MKESSIMFCNLYKPSPYIVPGIVDVFPILDTNRQIKNIFNFFCDYFQTPPDQDFRSRKKIYVNPRSWTMFISVCMGITFQESAGFFGKTHSNAVHSSRNLISQIQVYKEEKDLFHYAYAFFKLHTFPEPGSSFITLFLSIFQDELSSNKNMLNPFAKNLEIRPAPIS